MASTSRNNRSGLIFQYIVRQSQHNSMHNRLAKTLPFVYSLFILSSEPTTLHYSCPKIIQVLPHIGMVVEKSLSRDQKSLSHCQGLFYSDILNHDQKQPQSRNVHYSRYNIGWNMDLNLLSISSLAVEPVHGGTEPAPASQSRPLDQAEAPSGETPKVDNRTIIRKRDIPSCNFCRRRKVKCDRADPCSHCVRSGTPCAYITTSRAKRGTKGGRRKLDSELLNRIVRLENLLKKVNGDHCDETSAVQAATDGEGTVCRLHSFTNFHRDYFAKILVHR